MEPKPSGSKLVEILPPPKPWQRPYACAAMAEAAKTGEEIGIKADDWYAMEDALGELLSADDWPSLCWHTDTDHFTLKRRYLTVLIEALERTPKLTRLRVWTMPDAENCSHKRCGRKQAIRDREYALRVYAAARARGEV